MRSPTPMLPSHRALPGRATLRDGTCVLLRLQSPADRPLIADLFAGLSARSRYLRFFAGVPARLPEPHLDRLAAVDGRDHVAVLALHGGRAVGAARYVRTAPEEAELAFTVTDAFQGRGLGRLLVDRLIAHALAAGVTTLTFEALRENRAARGLARSLGARVRDHGDVTVARLELVGAVAA